MNQPQPQAKTPATGPYSFDPTILREYDIRGQVGINLGEQDAYALGRAFGTYVRRQERKEATKICVGYDGRTTSPALSGALIRGLNESGIDVKNIGLGPTPMLYFAVKDHGADAGIMVTGSHNPPDYNGFKMMLQTGSVFGEAIQALGTLAANADFETGSGRTQHIDIRQNYVDRLLKDLETGRELKIAWDAGNGASGDILKALTDKLPGEHILLYESIDGAFPNHHPDPTVDKNLEDLRKAVLENGCDLGIAFDGDGDRIGAVDEKGNILRCDALMTIYAADVLKTHPGTAIIGDVKCSQMMFDEIEKLGGRPIMWKTGHSLVKAKMAEENAPLAGELSGHIFFADKYYGFDDAQYCAIRLINAVARTQAPFSSLTAHLPKLFSTPEIRIEVDEREKFDLVPRIIENLKGRENGNIRINEIDGVRVTTPEGWWLVRPSNTQDVLVSRVEANSREAMDNLLDMVQKEVAKLGYALKVA
ncbi:MAG: phosphomannomutase/phosphoglucomutase [Rhodospirillales bacterium]|nr:phosphomannomutase/phosphoglucomutase [Alphaproteobacteria bacterium]USO02905.1 MAG: phosphomannomutase/phosphoglucomutase [Rhodospirillales bacterium]